MSRSDEYKFLSSAGYSLNINEPTKNKVSVVFEYIVHNYTRELTLEETAGIANMTPNSFCRFFKKCFRKTFKDFLNEIRIGNASKLLIDDGLPVSLAAYHSGFNNLTHFHRQFKRYYRTTPGNFIKRHIEHANKMSVADS
jgi:AraC-like DNA-binding protein